MKRKVYCGNSSCINKHREHVHPDDTQYPHGLSLAAAERLYGSEDDQRHEETVRYH
jgi:hypothetical protein